jgi:polar amino acid transport system substrate-binding protein
LHDKEVARMKKALLTVLALAVAVGLFSVATAGEVYKVASDTTWPPFEWADAQGNLLGFDLDMMRCIAVLEGFEIAISSYDWDIIFDDVGSGRMDIGASGATIRPDREEKVDFSAPYWTSDQAILVRTVPDPDNPGQYLPEINIVEALAGGRTIGAQLETTGAGWIEDEVIGKGFDVDLAEYTLYPLAVLDLINGNVDAVIQDEPASAASAAAEDAIMVAGIIKTNENFGFFVAEGDPKGLLDLIDDGVEQLKDLGVYDDLIAAYMGTDLVKVEAAWKASIGLLESGDVVGFAAQLAALANQ